MHIVNLTLVAACACVPNSLADLSLSGLLCSIDHDQLPISICHMDLVLQQRQSCQAVRYAHMHCSWNFSRLAVFMSGYHQWLLHLIHQLTRQCHSQTWSMPYAA